MRRDGAMGRWASVALVVAAALCCVSCQDAQRCRAWAGSDGRASFFQCGDQKERLVECDLRQWRTTKSTVCTCSCGGVVGSSFETHDLATFDTRDGAIAVCNANCGWQLRK